MAAVPNLPEVATALASGDPRIAFSGANRAAQIAIQPDTNIAVTVYDKVYENGRPCGAYSFLSCTWPKNDVETGRIILKGNDPLIPVMRACSSTVVPVVVETGNMLWNGRVENTDYAMDDKGNWTLTASLIGDTNFLNHVLCWVNFLTPVEYQGPLHEAVYVGPACSVIETLISEQCFRLQSGMYDMLNNWSTLNLDWQTWFQKWIAFNGDVAEMLSTPVYVKHHDFFTDSSPWVFETGRFDVLLPMIQDICKTNGIDIEIKLWRPGDPQPDPNNVTLQIATYVVTVTDRSGITGPLNAGLLGGIFTDFADLQQGVFGQALSPFESQQALNLADQGIYIAPEIGVGFTPPDAYIIADHPNTPLTGASIVDHHAMAYQIVIGGKSPQWLDDLINSTLEFAIDALEILIGFTGIPDTLLDGLFDDSLLAFELVDNYGRYVDNGPYMYPEQMFPSASTPYNVDALMAMISGMWDTRGWTAAKVTFRNGFPLTAGKDFYRGGMMAIGLQSTGEVLYDYVENITLTDDRLKHRCDIEVQVGDGKLHQNPMAIFQRRMKDFWKVIHAITLQDQQ